jgi:hypothetical protein
LGISRRSSGDRRKSDASFNKRNPRGKWATVTITGIIGVYKNIENDILNIDLCYNLTKY